MDTDQILKHLEWLDDERRKDKDIIARQEERIASIEGNINAAYQQVKELETEITRLNTVISRMDHFDEALLQQRIETNRQYEEVDKHTKKREEEAEKVRRVEMRAMDASLVEIRKELEPISALKRGLQARVEEENRLNRSLDEVRVKIQELRRGEEEYSRTYRLIEDGRRQDSKRLVDLQGETTALRKRVDEQRVQAEILTSGFRKVEGRVNELSAAESQRREEQVAFLDKQNLLQVERERIWKDWQSRFEAVEGQSTEVIAQLQTLDASHRNVRQAKEELEDLIQRVERRISEITEIQRLSEERFRQEWVTFKADDQKRWTNYTLSQDEQRAESTRHFEKLIERVTILEDGVQELSDLIEQMNEQSEKRLQELLALAHEWVASYERTLGHVR